MFTIFIFDGVTVKTSLILLCKGNKGIYQIGSRVMLSHNRIIEPLTIHQEMVILNTISLSRKALSFVFWYHCVFVSVSCLLEKLLPPDKQQLRPVCFYASIPVRTALHPLVSQIL